MKKSLWIAAVAMAMGLSAHADQAVYSTWNFEDGTIGAALPAVGYTSWTSNGVAYVQSGGASGGKSLYFEGVVTNQFNATTLNSKWYKMDFFMKPTRLESLELLDSVDATARMAFYFDVNSNFNLMHGKDGGAWTTSKWTGVFYDTNSWVRIAIEQDCAATVGTPAYSAFTVAINGTNLTSALAYTRTSTNNTGFTGPASGGRWFMVRTSTGGAGMSALVAMGAGMLDDVVNTDQLIIPVKAASVNTALGTITPVDGSSVTNTLPNTYTLTIPAGVAAYVTGLKVDSTQVYGNSDTNTPTKDWTLSYAQIHVYGTNVVALFEARPDTSASWLTNYIPVGPGETYTTVAEAEAGDLDGDGINNKDEAILGTDPTTNTSALKITNIAVNAQGEILVSFPGSGAGGSGMYKLFQADDPNGPWTYVDQTPKANGSQTINTPPVTTKKFYRIEMPYIGD